MNIHFRKNRLSIVLAFAAALGLPGCASFSPDGGMAAVSEVTGQTIGKQVAFLRTAEEAGTGARRGAPPAWPHPERGCRRADRAAQQHGPAGRLQRTGAGGDRPGAAEPAAEPDLFDFADRRRRRQRDRAPGRRRHPRAGDAAVPLRYRARAIPAGATARRNGDAAARRRGPAQLLPRRRRATRRSAC